MDDTQNQPVAPSLVGPALQQTAQVPAPAPPVSVGKTKEVAPQSQELVGPIEIVGSDAIEKEPLPPEVSGWMEKVKRGESGEQKPPEIVIADKTAQAPTGDYASQPVFVLPLGKTEMRQGIHKSVNDSVRWLAQWCERLMKKLGNKVTLADE
ncbi:MAG TPA: hypothetical protein VLH19_03280 [Patescibacteria group bacterium]|nr:hypothetical protein [Patescibacteria group bacterium]